MPHPFWLLLLPPPWRKPPPASAALRIKGKYSEEKNVCLSDQYGLLTHLWFWFRGGRRGNRGLPIPAPHSLSGVQAISACARQRKQSSLECTDWEALTSGWIDFSLSQTWFFPPFFLSFRGTLSWAVGWIPCCWDADTPGVVWIKPSRHKSPVILLISMSSHTPTTSYRSALDPHGGATR